jgi:hypothetical protein
LDRFGLQKGNLFVTNAGRSEVQQARRNGVIDSATYYSAAATKYNHGDNDDDPDSLVALLGRFWGGYFATGYGFNYGCF